MQELRSVETIIILGVFIGCRTIACSCDGFQSRLRQIPRRVAFTDMSNGPSLCTNGTHVLCLRYLDGTNCLEIINRQPRNLPRTKINPDLSSLFRVSKSTSHPPDLVSRTRVSAFPLCAIFSCFFIWPASWIPIRPGQIICLHGTFIVTITCLSVLEISDHALGHRGLYSPMLHTNHDL